MKTILKLIMLTLGTCFSHVSGAQDFSAYQTPQDWVIAKNYYATFLLAQDSGLTHTILSDQDIYSMLEKRHARYIESANCKDVACFLRAFRWEEQEVEKIISVFSRKFQTNKELKAFVANKIIPSRTYGMDVSAGERAYLEKALRQDLNAMNYVIDVYAGGKKPNYPKIDSISFDVTKKAYLYLLKDVAQDILKDVRNPEEAFYESLWTAVRLLEVNERWDAAQLEPLIQLENKKAYDAIRQTDFERYPYSLLLTLGAGPEVYDQPISPGGMLRCRMAARSYFQGLAPFIVVSGGRVHPYKTPYIEAIEMKKYLMQALNVPEEAILIDPHARHTTTNMRNTARILLHYGFPADKYAIVNSSIPHIDAVEKMADRCVRELGYVPYVLGKRISEVIIEFKPREEALTIDPDEPMDP